VTAAALLARHGQRVAVFERSGAVGGRAVTHLENGFRLNLGPHAWYVEALAAKALERGVHIAGATRQLQKCCTTGLSAACAWQMEKSCWRRTWCLRWSLRPRDKWFRTSRRPSRRGGKA
jgi:monoamine oxidase